LQAWWCPLGRHEQIGAAHGDADGEGRVSASAVREARALVRCGKEPPGEQAGVSPRARQTGGAVPGRNVSSGALFDQLPRRQCLALIDHRAPGGKLEEIECLNEVGDLRRVGKRPGVGDRAQEDVSAVQVVPSMQPGLLY
jgi:hypothetical protein